MVMSKAEASPAAYPRPSDNGAIIGWLGSNMKIVSC